MPHTNTPTIALIICLQRLDKEGGCRGRPWQEYTRKTDDVWKTIVGTLHLGVNEETENDVKVLRQQLKAAKYEIRARYGKAGFLSLSPLSLSLSFQSCFLLFLIVDLEIPLHAG